MIHKAGDLSPEQKMALERLVGRAISDQDNISIRVLQPSPALPEEKRTEILKNLNSYFSGVDAQRQPVSRDEADEIINEALRSARPDISLKLRVLLDVNVLVRANERSMGSARAVLLALIGQGHTLLICSE